MEQSCQRGWTETIERTPNMMFQHVADCSCAHSSNNIIGFYILLTLLDVLLFYSIILKV